MIALLLVLRPKQGELVIQGTDMHIGITALCSAAALLFLPSIATLVMSPLRHAYQDTEEYVPILPAIAKHHDIKVRQDRAYITTAQIELDVPRKQMVPLPRIGGSARESQLSRHRDSELRNHGRSCRVVHGNQQ